MADMQRRIRRLRRFQPVLRVFRDRNNPLEVLSAEEVFCRYRFTPASIMALTGLVFNDLDVATERSMPVPPLLCVLVTLQFFASGSHYLLIGDIHGLATSSICRAVQKTTVAIAGLMDRYIKFPEDVATVQREFYSIAGFPKVIGCVDCTHITIMGPSVGEPDYVNRKGVHSINVQMVCDAKFFITNLVSKWPGSVHDSRIFRECRLAAKLETGNIDGLLLGDSGYACRPYLLTPYLRPSTPVQIRYNTALTKTRVLIEQTFGVLKRRFPCLRYGLRLSPERACLTIISCAVLHNFGLARGDIFTRETFLIDDQNDAAHIGVDHGLRFRDMFAASYFQ